MVWGSSPSIKKKSASMIYVKSDFKKKQSQGGAPEWDRALVTEKAKTPYVRRDEVHGCLVFTKFLFRGRQNKTPTFFQNSTSTPNRDSL